MLSLAWLPPKFNIFVLVKNPSQKYSKEIMYGFLVSYYFLSFLYLLYKIKSK